MSAKRTVGPVTGLAASGAAIGAALAQVVIHVFPGAAGVEEALTVLLTAAIAILGGYLAPPKDQDALVVEPDDDDVIDDADTEPEFDDEGDLDLDDLEDDDESNM